MTQKYTIISEAEAEQRYEEYLDEVFGTVEIAGFAYRTGCALKKIDPIAFRNGMLEWAYAIAHVEIE